MTAEEFLRNNEGSALNNDPIIIDVNGKNLPHINKSKFQTFSAGIFIVLMVLIFAFLFSMGHVVLAAIPERLIEATDVQYVDGVESKKIVFQRALQMGEIPQDTAEILKENGVLVGYIKNGEFVLANKSDGVLVLKIDDKIIEPSDFISVVSSDVLLYDAFQKATYGRAAYWFDDLAKEAFRQIGTSRNNYQEDSDYNEVMRNLVGEGSDVEVNTVSLVEKTRENSNGETETYYEYEENGKKANSGDKSTDFVEAVRQKNFAATKNEAALNAADTIKVADTITKEQRSSLFFLGFVENFSKTQVGEGNGSQITEVLNWIYENAENEVEDVGTIKPVKYYGSALEAPSLYAILSDNPINVADVANYSSDRALIITENQLNDSSGDVAIAGTVSSTGGKSKGSVGRFVDLDGTTADIETLEPLKPIVASSLVDNSPDSVAGISGGEFLVEGAINAGATVAQLGGGSMGDADAIKRYSRLTDSVLAMDARADKLNRSPFDITSRHTFLGSIIYNLAFYYRPSNLNLVSSFSSIMSSASNAVLSILPKTYADTTTAYLDNFGNCKTYHTIGAEGTPQCSRNITFDVSTLDDPFNNAEFIKFLEENTVLRESGKREVKPGSFLAKYLSYNNKRITPFGVIDGGIIDSVLNGSSSIPFITNILGMVEQFIDVSDEVKRLASGAAFVNSALNPDWENYKWAQRYTSLARAAAALKQSSSYGFVYNNIPYFEGDTNPVMAFYEKYYNLARE